MEKCQYNIGTYQAKIKKGEQVDPEGLGLVYTEAIEHQK